MIKFKYDAIAAGTELKPIRSWDPINGAPVEDQRHIVTKGYVVNILVDTFIGVVFQTEECGKQWVAIDRNGHFWSSFGNTREHAAQWLLKRARA